MGIPQTPLNQRLLFGTRMTAEPRIIRICVAARNREGWLGIAYAVHIRNWNEHALPLVRLCMSIGKGKTISAAMIVGRNIGESRLVQFHLEIAIV